MKVLMLANCFKGQWAGECYYQLAKGLVRAGVDMTVLLPQDKDTPAAEIMDGIKVKRFSYFWPQKYSSVAYGKGGVTANLKTSWLARFQLPLFLLVFLFRGAQLARQADLCHVITTSPALAGVLARWLWRKPYVITVIGTDVRNGPKAFSRFILNEAHRIVACSPELKDVLDGIGDFKHQCDIKHIIDFDRFTVRVEDGPLIRSELGLKPEDFVVAYIGRIDYLKGPLNLVKAAVLMKDRSPGIKFVLVGTGPQDEEARAIIKTHGLEGRVIMTGHRPDVHRVLAGADLFCSLSPLDNCFSATILEAMTARRPVLLTDAGHTREEFGHGECAWLVPREDPEALAETIEMLKRDESLRRKLAVAGPGCLDRLGFNRDIVIRQTLDMYREVLEEAAR